MTGNIIVNEFGKDYLAVFRALGDGEFRKSLTHEASLDPGFRDLMRMLDDPVYMKMSKDVGAAAKSLYPGMAMPKSLEYNLLKLQEYASARYPAGWKLIKEYEQATCNDMIRKGAVSVTAAPVISPDIYAISQVSPTIIGPTVVIDGAVVVMYIYGLGR